MRVVPTDLRVPVPDRPKRLCARPRCTRHKYETRELGIPDVAEHPTKSLSGRNYPRCRMTWSERATLDTGQNPRRSETTAGLLFAAEMKKWCSGKTSGLSLSLPKRVS